MEAYVKSFIEDVNQRLKISTLFDRNFQVTAGEIFWSGEKILLQESSLVDVLALGKNSQSFLKEFCHRSKSILNFGQKISIDKSANAVSKEEYKVYLGDHPLPGPNSFQSGETVINLLSKGSDRQLVVLIGGGASSLMEKIDDFFSLDELIEMNRQLLNSGASINEINCLRPIMSRLKAGGLAALVPHKNITSLIFSDLPDGAIEKVGSGPTHFYWEETEYLIDKLITGSLQKKLCSFVSSQAYKERVEKNHSLLQQKFLQHLKIGDWSVLYDALLSICQQRNISIETESIILENSKIDDSLATWFDFLRKELIYKKGIAVRIGLGELTVTVPKEILGRGGRNSHFVLNMMHLLYEKNVLALSENDLSQLQLFSYSPDGTDGNLGCAGAWGSLELFRRGKEKNVLPSQYIQTFDSGSYFDQLGGLIQVSVGELINTMDVRGCLKLP